MNKPQTHKLNIAASLAFMALLLFVSPAPAAVTVTTSNQQGVANTWPFTPSWVVNTNSSLIAGLAPSTALGNFSQEISSRNANTLTLGTNLTIGIIQPSTTTTSNYVTVGQSGGSLLIYTLPASANGYNLTNITVDGGWANNGRDQLGFVVLYSTVDNPTSFKFLSSVDYNPSVANNTASANQAIINDSLGGLIASNVAAIQFDFTFPGVENGYCGIAAITVGGTAAASVGSPFISLTASNQYNTASFTPSWPVESPSLINRTVAHDCNRYLHARRFGFATSAFTDGVMGQSGNLAYFGTVGSGGGQTLIYTLTNVVNGSDITNIVIYSGWGNNNRDGQYYDISYSTIAQPTTYFPITTVYYNPQSEIVPNNDPSANRVSIALNNGTALASGVANLKFNFNKPGDHNGFDNNYCGISEIIVQGHDTATPPPPPSPYLIQDTLPSHAETYVGDQVVFTAAVSN